MSPDFDTFLDSAAFSSGRGHRASRGHGPSAAIGPVGATREPLAARLPRSDADERRGSPASSAVTALRSTRSASPTKSSCRRPRRRVCSRTRGVARDRCGPAGPVRDCRVPHQRSACAAGRGCRPHREVARHQGHGPHPRRDHRVPFDLVVGRLARRGRRRDRRSARGALIPAVAVDRRGVRQPIRLLGRSPRLRDGTPLRALRDLDPRMARRARAPRHAGGTRSTRAGRSSKRS